ncbi:MAG: NUDIX hydrolase [Candidatus Daviesbacteria bacterium]|nr:NUDIX hydrolase [Candidatus Daviesbacteria bacterium]
MSIDVVNGFFRISIKAVIFDETRTKFLVILEDNGYWEVPGGGLDWGESPEECLKREIQEEMGLTVTYVSKNPTFLLLGKNMKGIWSAGVVYEVKVRDLNFTPTSECREIKFISPDELATINAFRTVKELAEKLMKSITDIEKIDYPRAVAHKISR